MQHSCGQKVSILMPSGLIRIPGALCAQARIVKAEVPVVVFQRTTLPSISAAASRRPSGLNAIMCRFGQTDGVGTNRVRVVSEGRPGNPCCMDWGNRLLLVRTNTNGMATSRAYSRTYGFISRMLPENENCQQTTKSGVVLCRVVAGWATRPET